MSKLILPGDQGFMTAEEINKLHAYDDVDSGAQAHHHTLGSGPNQAAPGTHAHAQLLHWYQNAAQSIPSAVWTTITLNTVYKETAPSYWIRNNPNPGEILIKKKGLYLVSYLATLNAMASMAYTRLTVNSTAYGGRHTSFTNGLDGHEWGGSIVQQLNVDDYVRLEIYNASAGAINTKITFNATEYIAPRLMLTYLG